MARSHAMGAGGVGVVTIEQPVCFVYVSIGLHTTSEMFYYCTYHSANMSCFKSHFLCRLWESRTSHEQLMFRPGRWTLFT